MRIGSGVGVLYKSGSDGVGLGGSWLKGVWLLAWQKVMGLSPFSVSGRPFRRARAAPNQTRHVPPRREQNKKAGPLRADYMNEWIFRLVRLGGKGDIKLP